MPTKTLEKCPHCEAELYAHEGSRVGLFHCNSCGCCFTDEGVLREGHDACSGQQAKDAQFENSQLQDRITRLERQLGNKTPIVDEDAVAKAVEAAKAEAEAEIAKMKEAHEKELAALKADAAKGQAKA